MRRIAGLMLILLLIASTATLVVLMPAGTFFTRTAQDYYGWQTDAYLSGQLHLKIAPRPEMLALENPWSTANAPYYIRDLALYDGRYYVYSGVAPILTVMAPIRLITGWFATEVFASVLLALVGCLATLGFLAEVRAQCALQVPRTVGAVTVLMAIIGNGALCWLAETGNTQLAAISGWAWQSVMLWAGMRAVRSTRSLCWMAFASFAYGLSVASRPSLLFAGAALLPFGWALWHRPATPERRKLPFAGAIIFPAAVIGAGLAWLNAKRFGSPLDFGIRFTLSHWGDTRNLAFFSLSNLKPNLSAYLLKAPSVTREFPFVEIGWREPVGILFLPYLAGIIGLRGWGRGTDTSVSRNAAALGVVVLLAGNAGPLLLYLVHWSRYGLDILIPMTLAASLGWLARSADAHGAQARRLGAMAMASAVINVLMVAAMFFETLD